MEGYFFRRIIADEILSFYRCAIACSTVLMVMISLNTEVFLSLNSSSLTNSRASKTDLDLASHPEWNHQTGWKNVLNNVRLIIQPSLLLWLIVPWLEIFPNSSLLLGFHRLISTMNQFPSFSPSG